MRKVYALTYEYSYANNNDGKQSPDEAGGILGLFEDEDDAQKELKIQEDSGDWGEACWRLTPLGARCSDPDANDGWSEGGYILSVEAQNVTPSSKR